MALMIQHSTGRRRSAFLATVVFFLGLRPFGRLLAQPNIVFVLTDDQRWDTMWAMPIVRETLTSRGVEFENAYVTTPLCCPDRASTLSGGFYAHNTGVLTNRLPNGGVSKFNDADTIAVSLQRAGYRTALIGKYMNGYPRIAPYIPPGWSRFVVTANEYSWFDFTVAIGSSGSVPGHGEIERHGQYLTDYHLDRALEFMGDGDDEPFFLFFSTHAPHGPATPAPGDEKLFDGWHHRGRSYNEADVSDKPEFIQRKVRQNRTKAQKGTLDLNHTDEFARRQLRSLQAVDRAVGALVHKLEELGKLDETVFIFTSDNGFLWGEHWIWGKNRPYEESIRIPLIIVAPGVGAGTSDHLVAANLDIGATVLDLADIDAPTEGRSLMPLLRGEDPEDWRTDIFLESYVEYSAFVGLLTRDADGARQWKYIENATEDVELYDLAADPFEEVNIANDPVHAALIRSLKSRVDESRKIMILKDDIPAGIQGQPYAYQLRTWGGEPPYVWTELPRRGLPEGLTLNPETGGISGVPTRSGKTRSRIQVEDASIALHRRKPRYHAIELEFVIRPQRASEPD